MKLKLGYCGTAFVLECSLIRRKVMESETASAPDHQQHRFLNPLPGSRPTKMNPWNYFLEKRVLLAGTSFDFMFEHNGDLSNSVAVAVSRRDDDVVYGNKTVSGPIV
jgi:hypothetical protein